MDNVGGISTENDLHFNEVTIVKKKRKKDKRDRKGRIQSKCLVDDCKKLVWKGGMCYKHYFKAHPEKTKPTQYHSRKFKKALDTSGNGNKTVIEKIKEAIDQREEELAKLKSALEVVESMDIK